MTTEGLIRLEQVAPFSIGSLHVDPSMRQLKSGGTSLTLEPRVLQVLILLLESQGRVVGRQELIERCWSGRAVGEQAINRVMAILRKLSADHGEPFTIHTVIKVGYRLTVSGCVAPADTPQEARESASGYTLKPEADRLPPVVPFDRALRHAPLTSTLTRRHLLVGAAAAGGAAAALSAGLFSAKPRSTVDTLPPEAKAFIDRGFDELDIWLPGFQKQAPAYFLRATQIAPQAASAWGALALGYAASINFFDPAEMQATTASARAAATRALELDPEDPDAHAALYLLQPWFRRWGTYETGIRQLLRKAPDHPFLLTALGQCLCDVGRWRDARTLMLRATMQSDRLRPKIILALASWHLEQLKDAERLFLQMIHAWPSHATLHSIYVNFLVLTGQSEKAEQAIVQLQDKERGFRVMPPELAIAASRAIAHGNPATKRAIARSIAATRARGDMAPAPALSYLSILGDVDAAFEVLRPFLFGGGLPWDERFRPVWPIQRQTDLLFGLPMRNLRADPRFGQVTRALGLEDYWRTSGTAPDYRAA